MSKALELTQELISRASVSPTDGGCQALMIERLEAIGFKVESMRFGPVDGSLLELARRHARRNPMILTTDSPLYGECRKGGLSVSHMDEITLSER